MVLLCTLCSRTDARFKTRDALADHYIRMHGAVFFCRFCDNHFHNHLERDKHDRNVHVLNYTKSCICPFCDDRFDCKQQFDNHVSSFHSVEKDAVTCSICDRISRCVAQFDWHIQRCHRQRNTAQSRDRSSSPEEVTPVRLKVRKANTHVQSIRELFSSSDEASQSDDEPILTGAPVSKRKVLQALAERNRVQQVNSVVHQPHRTFPASKRTQHGGALMVDGSRPRDRNFRDISCRSDIACGSVHNDVVNSTSTNAVSGKYICTLCSEKTETPRLHLQRFHSVSRDWHSFFSMARLPNEHSPPPTASYSNSRPIPPDYLIHDLQAIQSLPFNRGREPDTGVNQTALTSVRNDSCGVKPYRPMRERNGEQDVISNNRPLIANDRPVVEKRVVRQLEQVSTPDVDVVDLTTCDLKIEDVTASAMIDVYQPTQPPSPEFHQHGVPLKEPTSIANAGLVSQHRVDAVAQSSVGCNSTTSSSATRAAVVRPPVVDDAVVGNHVPSSVSSAMPLLTTAAVANPYAFLLESFTRNMQQLASSYVRQFAQLLTERGMAPLPAAVSNDKNSIPLPVVQNDKYVKKSRFSNPDVVGNVMNNTVDPIGYVINVHVEVGKINLLKDDDLNGIAVARRVVFCVLHSDVVQSKEYRLIQIKGQLINCQNAESDLQKVLSKLDDEDLIVDKIIISQPVADAVCANNFEALHRVYMVTGVSAKLVVHSTVTLIGPRKNVPMAKRMIEMCVS